MATSRREKWIQRMSRVGVNHLLALAARRRGLLALAYHRIGTSCDQPYDDELFSASAEAFRKQLLYIRAHFDVLSVDDLLEATSSDRLIVKRASALITFDDGYVDNYDTAFPILREVGLPALFFIAAGFVDEPRLTWWDRVAYIVKNSAREVLQLDYPTKTTVELSCNGQSRAIKRILRLYKETPQIDESRFFEQLESRAEVTVDSRELGKGQFMTWDQVREMKRAGMDIGAHTYSHPVLSRISESEQGRELSQSRERLSFETGGPIQVMAYPVGGPGAFTDVTKRLARDAGYRVAFSYYGGFNRSGHADLLDMRRMAVERYDSFPMFSFRASTNNLWGRSIL